VFKENKGEIKKNYENFISLIFKKKIIIIISKINFPSVGQIKLVHGPTFGTFSELGTMVNIRTTY